jgi:O-antigen/teichoic acid export membrane protein
VTKATEMARVSAKGGFHVLWGLVASTVISAIGTIIIASLLGPDNYGLYAIALTAPNLIATFRDWGINTAMTKYSAQYNSENNIAKIRSIFVSGLLFEIILGLILSIISFTLSGLLANSLSRPSITPLIQIASFFILTSALITAATAAFTGMETMHLNSIMLVIQSIFKTGLIVAFILLGFGTLGAVTGFTLAVLVAGLTGLLLMWIMYKSLPKPTHSKLEIMATIKTMFTYGLPLSIGAILAGFLAQFFSYILAIYVTGNTGDIAIGNYNVALNFVVLITFFATPVTTMLFPAFSKIDTQKDKDLMKQVYQYSVKYAALVVVPAAMMVMALSQPAIETIFQDKYSQAPLFLALLSITYLFSAFGSLSTGNLINAQGYTKYMLKLTILSAAVGFPLSFVLISQFGVIGLIVTSLIYGIPTLIIALQFIRKQFGVSVDWVSSAKILLSSGVAGIVTYFLVSLMSFSSPVRLVIGVIIFLIMCVFAMLVSRTLNRADLNNLQEIINALGPLRKPLRFLLKLIEKLMMILRLDNT